MTASFEIPAHEATGNGVVKSEKRTCVGRVRALLARTGNSNPGLIVICIQYQSAALSAESWRGTSATPPALSSPAPLMLRSARWLALLIAPELRGEG